MKLEEAVQIVAAWAASEPLVREAYIFGSRVRGTHRPDSDIDIAVKINKQPGDESEYVCWAFEGDRLTERLQKLIPVKVQLEWYDPIETPHVRMGIVESSVKAYQESST
jgi:predicted nucleotidyltransferase